MSGKLFASLSDISKIANLELSMSQLNHPFETLKLFLNSVFNLQEGDWLLFKKELSIAKYHEKELIYTPGDTCDKLLFISSGVIRSYLIDKNGKDFTWSIHYNNPMLKVINLFAVDYASFVNNEPTELFFECILDAEVIVVPRDSLHKLYERNSFWQKVGRILSEQAYYYTHKRTLSLLTKSAKERYIQLCDQNPLLLSILPQYHLASYLGVTPQSLSRLKMK